MPLDGRVLADISSLANVQIRGMFSICGFSIYKLSIFRLSNYRVLPLLNLETKLSRCFEFLTLAWGVSEHIMSSSMRTKPWLVSRLMAPTLDVKLRNSTPPTLLPFFQSLPLVSSTLFVFNHFCWKCRFCPCFKATINMADRA
jgi:hypothetical protein